LKRGIIGDTRGWDWFNATAMGTIDRQDGAIILQNEQRQEAYRWKFTRGWVCKYTGPSLKSDSSAVAIESVEICHEGLEVVP
jgi:phage tail-like protein